MIECSNEYIYYKRKKRKINFKRFFHFLLVVFISTAIVLYYFGVIAPHVQSVCTEKIRSINVKSINLSVINSISHTDDYSQFVNIDKNDNGDIVLISANSSKINSLSRGIVKESNERLRDELKKGVKIPWVVFTGFSLLSGYGKEVDFKLLSVENVTCDFISNFTSCGINQTLHRISVQIVSEIAINLPLNRTVNKYSTEVLVSETILVGKVPDIYLGNNVLG